MSCIRALLRALRKESRGMEPESPSASSSSSSSESELESASSPYEKLRLAFMCQCPQ